MGTHRIEDGCISCATCTEACPVNAITEQDEVHVIDEKVCNDCGACNSICPADVIVWEITA